MVNGFARIIRKPSLQERFSVLKIAALALFILLGTHFEFPGEVSGAGLGFAIRLGMAAVIPAYILLSRRSDISILHGYVIFLICMYFLLINATDFTYFAILGCLSIVWGLLMASLSINGAANTIVFLCTGYLTFHMIGLALGIFIYVATGQIVDLHSVIFPFSEARVGELKGFVRITGFHVEPGSYSNFIYLVVLVRSLFMMRILSWFNAIAMASTMLTLAAWSVIGFGAFLIASLVELLLFNKTRLPFVLSVSVSVAVILPSILIDEFENDYTIYITDRFSGSDYDPSRNDKILAFISWQNEITDAIFIGNPLPKAYCPFCLSPQDFGTMINMTYYFGVVPTLLLLLALSLNTLRRLNGAFLIFAAPLIISKAYFFEPLVWLIIGVMLFIRAQPSVERLEGPAFAGDIH
ncbi:conserved membrane hypothetical protein [Gammaproteobacteria bacterium]